MGGPQDVLAAGACRLNDDGQPPAHLSEVYGLPIRCLVDPLAWLVRRELDLLSLDEDTPRLVGVGLERVRLVVLLGAADLIGRTVIAPAQVPAGFVVALVGAPYFVYLLARSRA